MSDYQARAVTLVEIISAVHRAEREKSFFEVKSFK